ncbi:hypothetical protein [Nonomuraea sp. SYSU D8015]|uniref:hypothetical protein n=1 Tax=Nonomuraea sp. SYSU D8015 TaxID=2593644 RepID=UPI001660E1F7|nr:hypothetical protein [Nonomuraea sp. SYSU D8015]
MYLPVTVIKAMNEKAEKSGLTLSAVAAALVTRARRGELPAEFLIPPKFERGETKKTQNVYLSDDVWTEGEGAAIIPEKDRPRFVTALMYAYSRCLVDVQLTVTIT